MDQKVRARPISFRDSTVLFQQSLFTYGPAPYVEAGIHMWYEADQGKKVWKNDADPFLSPLNCPKQIDTMPKDPTSYITPSRLACALLALVLDYSIVIEDKEEERAGKERKEYDDDGTESGSNGCRILDQSSYLSLSSVCFEWGNGVGFKICSGGNEKGKGKESSLKRSAHLISSPGEGGSGSQDEDGSPGQPNKRPQPNKRGSSKAPRASNNRCSFGCPYYKNNPLEHQVCAEWHHFKLSEVKEHCKAVHLKPIQCGRCRKFRAGGHEQLTQHLMYGDCEKSEVPDPSEIVAAEKAIEVEKAKTWERIYEILFPLYIPSPFWEGQAEIMVDPINWPQDYTTVPEGYRIGLAKFLKNRLSSTQGDIDGLLIEYDANWTSKPHSQLSLPGYEDSGADFTNNAEGPSQNTLDIDDLYYGPLW